jgi:hypothetical protein
VKAQRLDGLASRTDTRTNPNGHAAVMDPAQVRVDQCRNECQAV